MIADRTPGIHRQGVSRPQGFAMIAFLTRRATGSPAVALTAFSLNAASPQAHAEDKVLRVGTLKLIHGISAYFYEKFAPPGYTVEVVPFESPTDGKNTVLTGTVDTCIHGIAALILGAAAGKKAARERGIPVSLTTLPGHHHFSILDELARRDGR
jgi:hypothetical protein